MTASFLDEMARSSTRRVAAAKRLASEAQLDALARAAPQPVRLSRSAAGFDLIAESKRRSPAAGQLAADGDDIVERVLAYARAGAAAVSVLTEPTRFGGSLEHLQAAARALQPHAVPTMRKDFIVDPYQILEARVAGAAGVLVILRMLTSEQITALLECAHRVGLFVLLETFDEADIELAHDIVSGRPPAQLLIGVNCRDLATLVVVPGRLERLARLLPRSVPRVAESGVASAADAARIAAAGYDLALVGSALMAGDDSAVLARAMLAAGRRARPQGSP